MRGLPASGLDAAALARMAMPTAGIAAQALSHHRAPWWLPGGHAQTVWTALGTRPDPDGIVARLRRERWTTPDGDFIDVDRLPATRPDAARIVLFHGLEGSVASPYARALAAACAASGHAFALPHFRGCSGELNLAPRAYHSGDIDEIEWMLTRLQQDDPRPLHAIGVSLGGNALLHWAAQAGQQASRRVAAVAAVSAPLDLAACGAAIDAGIANRLLYGRHFLRTMKPKAMAKLRQHPGLFDAQRLARARSLREFDDVFTAPLHGFAGVDDYWQRASAGPHLHRIRVPALVLNARNDPIVPAASLPGHAPTGDWVTLWQPRQGGHVGFCRGAWPGELRGLAHGLLNWLTSTAPPMA